MKQRKREIEPLRGLYLPSATRLSTPRTLVGHEQPVTYDSFRAAYDARLPEIFECGLQNLD